MRCWRLPTWLFLRLKLVFRFILRWNRSLAWICLWLFVCLLWRLILLCILLVFVTSFTFGGIWFFLILCSRALLAAERLISLINNLSCLFLLKVIRLRRRICRLSPWIVLSRKWISCISKVIKIIIILIWLIRMSSSLLISSEIIKMLIPPILILIKVRYIRCVMFNKLTRLLVLSLHLSLWLLLLKLSMFTHSPWI